MKTGAEAELLTDCKLKVDTGTAGCLGQHDGHSATSVRIEICQIHGCSMM